MFDELEFLSQPSHWLRCDQNCPLQRYTENREIESHMRALVQQFPHLASLVEVGNSSLGQPIVGIQITMGVEEDREMLKPKVF